MLVSDIRSKTQFDIGHPWLQGVQLKRCSYKGAVECIWVVCKGFCEHYLISTGGNLLCYYSDFLLDQKETCYNVMNSRGRLSYKHHFAQILLEFNTYDILLLIDKSFPYLQKNERYITKKYSKKSK